MVARPASSFYQFRKFAQRNTAAVAAATTIALVLVAAERTKQLLKGAQPLIDNESDNKEVVTALREIAAGQILVMA